MHIGPRRIVAIVAVVASLALATACTGGSTPSPTPSDTGRLPDVAAPLGLGDVARFGAVATMNAGSNCTGTLIDTGVSGGPAYVLTNGHCAGDVGRSSQVTTVGEEWFGTAEFFRAAGNLDNTLTVDVDEIAYSTMRHTDTAVLRLDKTLGELEALGVTPIPVADEEPAAGTQVVNVGVPVQDLDHDDWVLRRGDCTLGSQHTLIEFTWLWFGVWSNDCPGIVQGSSGSPLLTVDADGAPTAIVGVINTTSWGVSAADGGACFLNRPCQVTADGPTMVEKTSYAQSVAGIGSCFDASTGRFGLTERCPLPRSSVWAERGGGAFRGAGLPNASGGLPEASFVGQRAGTVRTALTPLGDGTTCLDPGTYTDAPPVVLPQAGDPWDQLGVVVPADLPQTEGWYALCAVSGDDHAGAASVLFEVDRTPPIVEAGADVDDIGGGALVVRPHLNPPEISTVRFTWGNPDTVNCTDTAAFQNFFVVPLTLEPADLPAVYCLYGLDAAGNATPVTTIPIGS